MGWRYRLRLWVIRRFAVGIARTQKRCYITLRRRHPLASEEQILRQVLRARLGYSEADVENMALECKTLYDLCWWVIVREFMEACKDPIDAGYARYMLENLVSDAVRRVLESP